MLTIGTGTASQRISRRNFLTAGTLGIVGLSLADVFRLRAAAGTPVRSPKSVIMVWLFGGPSHIDMYDLKPDAPADIRGELKPIPTNVPGFDICELMPQQAKIADKLALLRTVKFDRRTSHFVTEIMSGYAPEPPKEQGTRPYFGSVVSKLQGSGDVPPYVHLNGSTAVFGKSSDPAYLGEAHHAFMPDSTALNNLRLRGGAPRLQDRKALLGAFDTLRRDIDGNRGAMVGLDTFQEHALNMIAGARIPDALDVQKEPAATRAKYAKSTQWLQAIRLAQAGVSVVTLEAGMGNWDFHGGPVANQKLYHKFLPDFDGLVHAMVTELHARGLEKDVAILFWGEMGRTPRINDKGGRDHWPQVGFGLLAGGGFQTGQVIGRTSPHAEFAVDRPYSVQNVLATLYAHLGIDPSQNLKDLSGRPMPLLDDVEPIGPLLG